jgi:porphobilinogen synthase
MVLTFPSIRLRRLRQHPALRSLVRETELNLDDLVLPLFVKGKEGEKKPISSMPGHYQIPLSLLKQEINEIISLGIKSVILFGIPPYKDLYGSDSFQDNGIVQEAIKIIKDITADLLIISDICLCEYTEHGHCGFLSEWRGKLDVDNDKTLELLKKQAISHAKAGTDVIAPSGMIDGMVQNIRIGLDEAGFQNIPILSYSAKYKSSMYGPFKAAAEGAAVFGDRSTLQIDPANAQEALREVEQDVAEGADILMIKPAHSYLDIIYRVKQAFPYIPLGAYHTSGEFCLIKAAAERGWIDEKSATLEILRGIRRAGADFIITYFTKDVAQWQIIN